MAFNLTLRWTDSAFTKTIFHLHKQQIRVYTYLPFNSWSQKTGPKRGINIALMNQTVI